MMTPLSTKIKQNTLSFGLICHRANAVVMTTESKRPSRGNLKTKRIKGVYPRKDKEMFIRHNKKSRRNSGISALSHSFKFTRI